ncbi:hypothetical protein [Acetivibrio cellulolyticus]|uniref:hypothetical protein n=1 Tax=Acetivibrio cellulolyticus TaxID=35830 RepID=UPI0001E2D50C|nr:hypothetical protein [Acetivibrio cellulolyticus]
MKSFKNVLSKAIFMLLLAGIIMFSVTGCSNGNGKKSETDSKASSQPTSQVSSKPDNVAGGKDSYTLKDVDTESALKLASGLLLGLADASIIPTEQPTVVVVKPGEKSCTIGSCDILQKVKLTEVPAIKVLDSKNAAWRITFTFKPEITIEVIDDAVNPQKAIKLYPDEKQ